MTEHISPYWRSVMERLKNDGSEKARAALAALSAQVCAKAAEMHILPYENADPLGAASYAVHGGKNACKGSRLVHQYKNRCLFLTVGSCFAHCRYCFRRESPVLNYPFASPKEIEDACSYIASHSEIQEILISGGDPLTVSDRQLERLFSALKDVRPSLLIRVCTRSPVFAPERFTPSLIALLQKFRPLWLIPHINHSAEFCERWSFEARRVLETLVQSGIPMQSQTVLLRGVNNTVDALCDLFYNLTLIGIKPGYLFQGDLAPGTAHFRVPIDEGVRLYERVRSELSGLSTPVYAVDIPSGGGKINLLQLDPELLNVKIERGEHTYIFTDSSGERREYPIEKTTV
ncbi:radical SAM protein [Treponema lecithinolyticum]|uniref:KamA family radical SAM protein n=1 Tax=Treponema lecithinolyticum TaxID=53418 RepID=UPI0028E52E60|nr:radical SAM protein [Treponema lecithinolyticum]